MAWWRRQAVQRQGWCLRSVSLLLYNDVPCPVAYRIMGIESFFYGPSRKSVQALLFLKYRTRSCKRCGSPCQNSIHSATIRKPPQNGGHGIFLSRNVAETRSYSSTRNDRPEILALCGDAHALMRLSRGRV